MGRPEEAVLEAMEARLAFSAVPTETTLGSGGPNRYPPPWSSTTTGWTRSSVGRS